MLSRRLTASALLLAALNAVAADSPWVVAFPQDTLKNDFRKSQVLAVEREFKKHPNIRFIYSGADGNTAQHVKNVERVIQDRINLLVIGPEDPDALAPIVEKAYDQGIPVVVTDRKVNSTKISTFIHADDRKIGATAAQFLAQKLKGKGVVLMMRGLPKAIVTQDRDQGFMEAIAAYPEIQVVKGVGNYLRGDTITEMERIHREGITYDAIYAHSDSMLSGVRLFYKTHQLNPADKLMVGVDYTTEAKEAILAGEQTASILFSLGAKETVDAAMALLQGQSVPKEIITETQLVTQDNVNQVEPIF